MQPHRVHRNVLSCQGRVDCRFCSVPLVASIRLSTILSRQAVSRLLSCVRTRVVKPHDGLSAGAAVCDGSLKRRGKPMEAVYCVPAWSSCEDALFERLCLKLQSIHRFVSTPSAGRFYERTDLRPGTRRGVPARQDSLLGVSKVALLQHPRQIDPIILWTFASS